MTKTLIQWQGAEASEEVGEGVLKRIEHEEGARNAHVIIDADHLERPVTGWLDTQDQQLWSDLTNAYVGERVRYCVVVHRKWRIDKSLPFDQLSTQDRVRELVELEPVSRLPATNGNEQARALDSQPAQVGAPAMDPSAGPGTQRAADRPAGPHSLEDYEAEVERLSHLLDRGLEALRTAAREWADAELSYRKLKAEVWLRVTEGTVPQREAVVNAECAEARHLRDLADGLKQSALEAVRSRRAQLSAVQTMIGAHKAEAELARTTP